MVRFRQLILAASVIYGEDPWDGDEYKARRYKGNDVVRTPAQAEALRAAGYKGKIRVTDQEPGRVKRSSLKPMGPNEDEEGPEEINIRWPGDTDGVTTRDYLVIPYRFKDGEIHEENYEWARGRVNRFMSRVGRVYLNGCIQFVDDTDTKGMYFISKILNIF